MGPLDNFIEEFAKENFFFHQENANSYRMEFTGTIDTFTVWLKVNNYTNGIIFCDAISPINVDPSRSLEFINFFNHINSGVNHGAFGLDVSDGEFGFATSIVFTDDELTFPMLENPVRFVSYMMDKYIPVIEAVQNGSSPEEALKLVD
ncbi:MAG: hypothetical protein J7604_11485 [Sporocytophaga sp.]|uniref:YbjN domain-containing protein n=1 Tax=Sporocytophaga sp. TaxID=2231183 RepID=UPI001B0905A5|nr:YbjN domain-containing protein [Sporocytophaga sp.]MBO9700823.1 hypothetical protein [Sporocytophaga sp.]